MHFTNPPCNCLSEVSIFLDQDPLSGPNVTHIDHILKSFGQQEFSILTSLQMSKRHALSRFDTKVFARLQVLQQTRLRKLLGNIFREGLIL